MSATQDLRPKRSNPFAGGSQNPFSSVDDIRLLKVPDAPETHERRQGRRGYLSASQGPMDNLFGMLDGKTPRAPQKIEVVRNVSEAPDDDASGGESPAPAPRFARV